MYDQIISDTPLSCSLSLMFNHKYVSFQLQYTHIITSYASRPPYIFLSVSALNSMYSGVPVVWPDDLHPLCFSLEVLSQWPGHSNLFHQHLKSQSFASSLSTVYHMALPIINIVKSLFKSNIYRYCMHSQTTYQLQIFRFVHVQDSQGLCRVDQAAKIVGTFIYPLIC